MKAEKKAFNPKDFFFGCNYWASNAGTEMWREFDPDVIRDDLARLKKHNVKYMRVFPNWRDFQPVEPYYCTGDVFREYRMTDGSLPTNKYYLDETMLERFKIFCDICEEFEIKLIVGLITGFMSSRLFVPPALYGKNLITDPIALYFEQLLVTGIVERFKDHNGIFAWDHGNECGCLSNPGTHFAAASWARTIANTVYSIDRTRPFITGLHSLTPDGIWRFDEQADVCDIMVTHPYIFWTRHGNYDANTYIKSTLLPTAYTKYYSDLTHKPCFIEEFGSIGPSCCSEETAAKILRVTYFSGLANGNFGLLWWCANEQSALTTPPYTWTMVECELGMSYLDKTPKPILKEMKRLAELDFNFELPPADIDAVCLVTQGQDAWGVAFMSYVLAKQVGLNISFADASKEIPEAKVYMLPSISKNDVMPKEMYLKLQQKVKDGAKLYISQDDGFLSDFEALTGNRIEDSEFAPYSGSFTLNGKEIAYNGKRKIHIKNINSTQIQTPLITKSSFGNGEVYFVNFPVEAMLIGKSRAFDNNICEVYREIFSEEIAGHLIKCHNENVALTIHRDDNKVIGIFVNHSEKEQKLSFTTDLKLTKVHYGNIDNCPPMDAVILEFTK